MKELNASRFNIQQDGPEDQFPAVLRLGKDGTGI
jgi:hypothetical protein